MHRLGQRRDVQVFRFTVKDTVEQQMLVIQARAVRFGFWCFAIKLTALGWSDCLDPWIGRICLSIDLSPSSSHLPQITHTQEKKAAIAKHALACVGGKKEEGRLNLEDLRRFFV